LEVHCGEGLLPGLEAGSRGADAGVARADQWAVGVSRVSYGRWDSSALRWSSRAVPGRGPARVQIGMRVSHTGSRPSVQEDAGPATTPGTARHRSHAHQRALQTPRQRRPSLADPRQCARCHNTSEAPSVFYTEQHRKGLYTLTRAWSRRTGARGSMPGVSPL
jgi:hypothetical protein